MIAATKKPTRQEYERTFKTTAPSRPSRQEYEKKLFETADSQIESDRFTIPGTFQYPIPETPAIIRAAEPKGFLRKAFGYTPPAKPPNWEYASPIEKFSHATIPISDFLGRVGSKITQELGLTKPEDKQRVLAGYMDEDLEWYQKSPEAIGWTSEKIAEYVALSGLFKLTGLHNVLTKAGQKAAQPFITKALSSPSGIRTLKTLSPTGLRSLGRQAIISFLRAAPENTAFISSWSALDALMKGKSTKQIGVEAAKGAGWGLGLTAGLSVLGTMARAPEIKMAFSRAIARLNQKYPRLADFLGKDVKQEVMNEWLAEYSRVSGRDVRFVDLTRNQQARFRNMVRTVEKELIKRARKEEALRAYYAKAAKKPSELLPAKKTAEEVAIFKKEVAITPPTEAIVAPERPVAPITPEKAVEVPPEAKQPWEMTKEEFLRSRYPTEEKYKEVAKTEKSPHVINHPFKRLRAQHQVEIMDRVAEGKPIPAKVLAEYPDLAKPKAVKPPTAAKEKITPISEPEIGVEKGEVAVEKSEAVGVTEKAIKGIDKIRKLDVKQRELEKSADQILATSGVGQAPPVFHRELGKVIEIQKKKAEIWNDIRNHIVKPSGKTLWQLAIEKYPVVRFGKEEALGIYAKDIDKLLAKPPTVAKMTLDELKKESAMFDEKIETEIARLDKIAPERQRFAETGIEHLSQEDVARYTEINYEIARREGISQAEAKRRVAEKRAARLAKAEPTKIEKELIERTEAEIKALPIDDQIDLIMGEIAGKLKGKEIIDLTKLNAMLKKAKSGAFPFENKQYREQIIKQLENNKLWAEKHNKIFKEAEPVKPKGKPGFIDVTPLLKVHKTFMGIVEPSKAVEIKLGKEPYAAVIKGIHQKDVGRIEFNEAQIEGQDKSLEQIIKWFSKFSEKDLKNFMLSRGTPKTKQAQIIQQEARKNLHKDLRRSDLFNTVQRIADSNYKYLQSVVGDDIHRVEDYFYGIWKNPKKVDKLLDYWKTTKRFTKEKKLPTVADALDYDSTMELRNWNPIENLKAEYIAISHLEGMNWLKDELLRTGKGKFIDDMLEAPLEWDMIHDPLFKDLRLQPDLAKLINNLIATNKITRIPLANTLREINNLTRTIKFIGSAFHLLSVAKQSVADSGYLGFLYKPTALRGFTRGFRANDPIFRTTAYKDYIRHGGGHRYSVESEARRTFNRAVDELNRNMGVAVKVGALPLKIPTSFVNWMFQSYIPKVKYSKFLDVVAEQEKKLDRKLTSPEKIDIIKEQQNFYGMMNERLFGRSGTVTSAMRFYFMSPGYAEGNYRSMVKGSTQWGGKGGFNANRSRSNIINSWLITATAATVGTLIFTGKPPEKPETLDDARDLFKIDTGKKDEKGRKIMIDLMTYDKDYWNVAFNMLRLRPDVAVGKSWKRIGGMKAPTAEMIVDLALMSMGKAIYDWKGDRVVEITDPFLLKAMKLTVFEVKKLSPISVSVFQQSKKRDIDTTVAAIETLLGFRPTKTEKDIREQKIISKMYSLAGQREELSYYIGQSTDPKKTVERYNKTVNGILESPYVPKSMKDKWGPKLLIDYENVITWKRFPAAKMNNDELQRAFDAHTLSVPYKRKGEPFRQMGDPKKGSERRISELKAEAQKRGIELKRGPRKPPRR